MTPTLIVDEDTIKDPIGSKMKELLLSYLSGNALEGGQGIIEIGNHYRNDALAANNKTVLTWPTGFYRDQTTGGQQLLLNVDKNVVFIFPITGDNKPAVMITAQGGPENPYVRIDPEYLSNWGEKKFVDMQLRNAREILHLWLSREQAKQKAKQ
jgi:hypothetical protein